MQFHIADLFEAAADRLPDREVVVCGERRASYAQLEERANRLAHHFEAHGLGPGDHIGIYGTNSVEWVEAMLAAYKLRAVPVNINFRYVEEELRYLFDNADLQALVHERRFAPRIQSLRSELPKLRHFIAIQDRSGIDCSELGSVDFEDALAGASPERKFGPRSGDDLYLLYTGGSTGMPKGVMWRQQDVIFALGGGIDHVTKVPAERPEDLIHKMNPDAFLIMCPLAPLMHGAAQWTTLGALFVGNRVVLTAGSFDPHDVLALVERERINTLSLTGDATARPLAEALAEEVGKRDLSCLVAIASTAAVFSPSVKRQFLDLLPNVVLTDAVGSTEQGFTGMKRIDKQSLSDARSQPGLVVNPGRDVSVLDDALQPVEPGSGAIGRIARSGNIPYGYYKDPQKSAEVFVEALGCRWSIPGDYATVEADGAIRMLGRGSVSINSGGEKIFPEEVEGALKAHPAVFDALVVGVPDERWGERVAAVVQARPGQAPGIEDLARHCRSLVASYKVPRELHLVEQIRRGPSGKPDYPWAKRTAAEGAHRA